jgi:hypothetical protein
MLDYVITENYEGLIVCSENMSFSHNSVDLLESVHFLISSETFILYLQCAFIKHFCY